MTDHQNFDFIHIIRVIGKKKKFILLFTALVLLVGILTCLIADKKYATQSIFIVKNPLMMDRNYVFRNTMFEHKEFFAVPDDIDQVEAIAKSDGLIWHLINNFELNKHYGTDNFGAIKRRFKWNYKFSRKDTKNIEIEFANEDPAYSQLVINECRKYIETAFLDYFLQTNAQITGNLKKELTNIERTIDSLTTAIDESRAANNLYDQMLPARSEQTIAASAKTTATQAKELEKLQSITVLKDRLVHDRTNYISLINEYAIFSHDDYDAFYLVQDGYMPSEATHPKTVFIIIGCLLGGLFFGAIIAVAGAFYTEKVKA